MRFKVEAQVGGQKYPLMSIFRIADITRPLMSVSNICDQGLQCFYTADKAVVRNAKGEDVYKFQRRGGLYVATMKLKKPSEPGTSPTPFPSPVR